MTRGETWAVRLLHDGVRAEGFPESVRIVDGYIGPDLYRAIAVVADQDNRFPRARNGEVGLDEALAIAQALKATPKNAAIVSLVDLPGQAFGRREEAAGLHVALAAAVDAYIHERRSGRQMFALLVGKAISGGFLTHGMQAGWIGALHDTGVEVHVMSAASVARVTRSRPEEVARIATVVPPTARDISSFAEFGAIDQIFSVRDPLVPTEGELKMIRAAIGSARARHLGLRDPVDRLGRGDSRTTRSLAIEVRRRFREAW